jgi:hypothetical protein
MGYRINYMKRAEIMTRFIKEPWCISKGLE